MASCSRATGCVVRFTWIAELIFIGIQLFVVADQGEQLAEWHTGAQSGHIELIFGQEHGDAEGLLEWCIAGGCGQRGDAIVIQLTSLVDVNALVCGHVVQLCG